uniref:Oxysterol-binding protein-like protein n=1 Tax=Philodina roseola TaxID=96448 RepID=B6S328_PHIRO|nr:oxysterol-binding protein-like protein [Philodina roseola]
MDARCFDHDFFCSLSKKNSLVETRRKHHHFSFVMHSNSTESMPIEINGRQKKVTLDIAVVLKDPAVVIVSDWLKVRGTLRYWTRLWAILKPGLLLLYRGPASMGHVKVCIRSNAFQNDKTFFSINLVTPRPTKRSGFCFKIWHQTGKSIWTQRGPNNEQSGSLTFPLPMSYLICRTSDTTAGRCWIDALELTMKYSKTLRNQPSMSFDLDTSYRSVESHSSFISDASFVGQEDIAFTNNKLETSEISKSGASVSDDSQDLLTDTNNKEDHDDDDEQNQTPYIVAPIEEMAELGNAEQTEEMVGENKSLIRHLLKQVRPGMDLSKVVLPTFILEPRSFLEKISDYYYHCDILEEAVNSPDPLIRMKTIVKFYLSGFYKKPKGLKKPYNPILGETYRCYFHHTKSNSKTFYLAEQISHHPPITNFHVSNRQEGFSIQGSILTKSKFYGNSISAILDGTARLTLLNRGEDYVMTMPYANCKGILIGKLTMELGGKVNIVCEKTRYSADIEFKLKPFIGGQEWINYIEGKICLEDDVMCTISGRWDDEISLLDKHTQTKSILWKITPEIVQSRLKRYIVPMEQQQENESERLWCRVTSAIQQNDQSSATKEKMLIEDEQRKLVRERKATGAEWQPHLFCLDAITKEWMYIHTDARPWDSHNDISTYEKNFIICTRTRHHTHPLLSHKPSIHTTLIPEKTDEISLILQRIESMLNRTNERLSVYEKEIHETSPQEFNYFSSPLIQLFLLVLIVAILLKYLLFSFSK